MERLELKLSVRIDERGLVTETEVTSSSGFPSFDSLVLETVKKWRFSPAIIDGVPTAEWYRDWLWSIQCD